MNIQIIVDLVVTNPYTLHTPLKGYSPRYSFCKSLFINYLQQLNYTSIPLYLYTGSRFKVQFKNFIWCPQTTKRYRGIVLDAKTIDIYNDSGTIPLTSRYSQGIVEVQSWTKSIVDIMINRIYINSKLNVYIPASDFNYDSKLLWQIDSNYRIALTKESIIQTKRKVNLARKLHRQGQYTDQEIDDLNNKWAKIIAWCEVFCPEVVN